MDVFEKSKENIEELLKNPVKFKKYNPDQLKYLDYKGEKGRLVCDNCGDEKKKGHLMIMPIFSDDPKLGAFSFFFCGARCARQWKLNTAKKGFPVSPRTIEKVKTDTGRELFAKEKNV